MGFRGSGEFKGSIIKLTYADDALMSNVSTRIISFGGFDANRLEHARLA